MKHHLKATELRGSHGLAWPLGVLLLVLALVMPTVVSGQPAATGQTPATTQAPVEVPPALLAAARTAQVSDPPATLVYANRPIVVFRATFLSRTPRERATVASELLDHLARDPRGTTVTTYALDEGTLVSVGGHLVFAILQTDLDPLAGERMDQKVADAAARLQIAFGEAVEARNLRNLLNGTLLALGATGLYFGVLWLLVRIHRVGAARLSLTTQRQLSKLPGGEILSGVSHAPEFVSGLFKLVAFLSGLLVTYAWLTFVLRQFPYARPWGESLTGALLSAAGTVGNQILNYLPDLFTVVLIVLITRFLTRVATLVFDAVEQERIVIPGLYPETAQPTRRIAIALLWLFALIVSYGYLPGSDSDVFKGVSVFVGLVVSLGSTGIMNQIMSGLTVTYSRALRKNDFVKIGDTEGTVIHLGTLSTKVRTLRNEEVTIPNTIVVSYATTNFSRHQQGGVWTSTSVTIGYDTPWRQVHALLLLAAERTEGIRRDPKPIVFQTALQDFYVQYTLLFCPSRPEGRILVLPALHANIQDAFNECGVQIMSPNYVLDPSEPKVVPPDRWYAAPAVPPTAPARKAALET